MFPLYAHDIFGYSVAMALATVVGLGFGFVLERSGFGKASVLVSQFYGNDNRVLKVMFTAIATAAAGIGLLGGVGLMDLGALSIPETFWLPQLVGGLLLGAGFVISGYCPGTALVAAGSGHRDGWWSIAGTMFGGVLFALAWPVLEGFYNTGGLGRLTLADVLGLPWAVVATGVAIVAIIAFLAAEPAERYFSQRAGVPAPANVPGLRNLAFGTMLGLGLAGFAADSVVSTPAVASVIPTPTSVDVVTLADQLVRDPTAVWLVDLRDREACVKERIPTAVCLPEGDADAKLIADLPATRTLVLYSNGELGRLPDSVASFSGDLQTLSGGFEAFDDQLLKTPQPPADNTRDAVERYQHLAALHGQLTGSAAAAPPVTVKAVKVKRAAKKGGGC